MVAHSRGDGARPRAQRCAGWVRGPRLWGLVVALVLLGSPAIASGESRRVGMSLEGGAPAAGRIQLHLEEELNDWVWARMDVGMDLGVVDAQPGHRVVPGGLVTFGVAMVVDVFSWVPSLYLGLGGGLNEDGARPRAVLRPGVRTYLTLDWSVTVEGVAEWVMLDGWYLGAAVGVGWQWE